MVDDPYSAVRVLLTDIDGEPDREGLAETPRRVVEALREMTAGVNVDVAKLLTTTFEAECDEMIVVRGIEFASLCEHHLLPFIGRATVGYLPGNGRVVGLSKLARLVDAFARRLQLQERMTDEIATAMQTHLEPAGVGVVVTATHYCMALRGVRRQAEMVTSSMLGALRDKPEARAEFLALARGT